MLCNTNNYSFCKLKNVSIYDGILEKRRERKKSTFSVLKEAQGFMQQTISARE
jgi:hypothetical protein